jgi:hypothetical protein
MLYTSGSQTFLFAEFLYFQKNVRSLKNQEFIFNIKTLVILSFNDKFFSFNFVKIPAKL